MKEAEEMEEGSDGNEYKQNELSNQEIAETIAAMVPSPTPAESAGFFKNQTGKLIFYTLGAIGIVVLLVGGILYYRQRKPSREE